MDAANIGERKIASLLTWTLKSKSFGQTRKTTRVVASNSTSDAEIRPRLTRAKRTHGYTESLLQVFIEAMAMESQQTKIIRYLFAAPAGTTCN